MQSPKWRARLTTPNSGPQIVETVKTPGNLDTTTTFYINGVAQTIQAGSSTSALNLSNGTFFLGNWGGTATYASPSWGKGSSDGDSLGRIAEFMVFDVVLTAAERTYWGSYLEEKYAIDAAYIPPPQGTVISIR